MNSDMKKKVNTLHTNQARIYMKALNLNGMSEDLKKLVLKPTVVSNNYKNETHKKVETFKKLETES